MCMFESIYHLCREMNALLSWAFMDSSHVLPEDPTEHRAISRETQQEPMEVDRPDHANQSINQSVDSQPLTREASASSVVARLQHLLVASEVYVSSLESCRAVVDSHIIQKAEKDAAMKTALSSAVAVPITTTLYHTPYFQVNHLGYYLLQRHFWILFWFPI